MAIWAAVCGILLTLLISCHFGCSLSEPPVFVINDVAYPAGTKFVAVYVVSESDGSTLDIECRYNSSTSTASWELVRSDYDGDGVNPGPAPVDPATLVIDALGALTVWAANGTTLSFFQISPQLEGLYRCTAAGGNLRILLTYDNPYLVATDTFITTRLVDTLSLRLVNRYADPELMLNLPPPVENVMVTAVSPFGDSGLRELAILSASESPNNPYETTYVVARPDDLVFGTITVTASIGGLMSNASINFEVVDFFGGLMRVTVVNEGEEVVFNCTPTNPELTASFSSSDNPEVMEIYPPNNNVWSFPALPEYSGFYQCSARFESLLTQRTFLLVYPNDEERDVVLYDFRSGDVLPTPYVLLNDVAREGLEFACVTRTGSVSIFSDNETRTEFYTTSDGSAQFTVGGDTISVTRGERFTRVVVDIGFSASYGDILTCKSDNSSDTANLRIVPASTFVAVNSSNGEMSAVINYGQSFIISFIFETVSGNEPQLLHNGTVITQALQMDPNNSQSLSYLVQGRSDAGGVYTLRAGQEPLSNASFILNVTLPVVTVGEEMVTVQEGENFTLSCSSSIPNLPLEWVHSLFGVERQSGPTFAVMGATFFNEGEYRCSVLENGEVAIASATVIVDVILSCLEHHAGGILWPQTLERETVNALCRDADARFSDGVQVSRTCGPSGLSVFREPSGYSTWLDPNFSGCTLASSEPQTFVIFSLYYELVGGADEQFVVDNIDSIQMELDSYTMSRTSRFSSSELVVVPGIISLLDNVVILGIRLRYTVNLNEEIPDGNFDINELSQVIHCGLDIMPDINSTRALQGVFLIDGNGDTVGFMRSDVCECVPVLVNSLNIPDDILPPPLEQRKKRGLQQCVNQFFDFQGICNGTTAPPCDCIVEECQCQSPYVGNGQICTLDRDGDTFPEVVPQLICKEGSEISYCQQDLCPNVPNNPANNTAPCTGFDSSTGVEFCMAEIDAVWEIEWPFLQVEDSITVPCGVNYTGNSTRECGSGGVWGDPDVSMCSNRVFNSVQVEIALLLGEEDIDGALAAFEGLVNATAEPLFPSNVNTAIEDVDELLTLLEDQAAFEDAQNVNAIFEVLDNLLVDDNTESFEILEDVGAGQRVLNNTERYALYVAQVLENQGMDTVINITGENIFLRAQSLSVDNLEEDYVFPEPEDVTGLALTNGSSASILLPQELLFSRGMGGNVGVASLLFRNLQSFLPNDTEVTHPRSLVISSQVSQRGGNGEAVEALLDNPVTITFSFEAREDEEILFDEICCVFWDFGGNSATKTGSESVRWSSEGLRTESVTRDGDTVTVTCSSDHLTSFAVLVDVGGARIESEALRIVSYIGLAISLACLLLTIIFFISFGKKLFAAVHNFVHLNLAIALFCGYLVFAVGVELANHEKIPCNVVTALVQYFLLSAFCWMMCEGIMLYLMLVVVFSTLSKKWWFFLLLGWGIPLIFVVIGLGAVHDEYGVKDSSSDSDDYYKYCWLSSGEGTYAIWTFVAPMLAIIIINTVFLILVLGSIVRSRANRQKEVESGYKVDIVVTVVKASVILLPLLGLTWVFGLFAVNENTVVFAWLFTIFNSLQGLFIFIFHVIRNDKVWGMVKKRYATYSTSRASKSTGSTGIKSSKYHSVASTSTGGVEMKSYVDADASEVKTDLGDDKEPTKEEQA